MKTFMASPSTIDRKWYVVDAADMTLGRLASEVAKVLRGKNKPIFTPHMDTGDNVIVINASKIKVLSSFRLCRRHERDYIERKTGEETGAGYRTCSKGNASERTFRKTNVQKTSCIRRTGACTCSSET